MRSSTAGIEVFKAVTFGPKMKKLVGMVCRVRCVQNIGLFCM
jgi:hypothetical protein